MRHWVTIAFLFVGLTTLAQDAIQEFLLSPPAHKTPNSRYRNISVLDLREDTSSLGFFRNGGGSNKKIKVLSGASLQSQFIGLLNSLVDSNAGYGELVVQVRTFTFSGSNRTPTRKGSCHIRFALYSKTGPYYYKVAHIDSLVFVKSDNMVPELMKKTEEVIVNFISDNLNKDLSDSLSYNYIQLKHIELVEKNRMPLYRAVEYKEGVYFTYQSFRNQKPDCNGIISADDKWINSVRIEDESGRLIKLKNKAVYAVVHHGVPYISTVYGYYQLRKRKNDFYFIGKVKISADPGDVAYAAVVYGAAWAFIESFDKPTAYEIKLDYFNGSFIRIRDLGIKPE